MMTAKIVDKLLLEHATQFQFCSHDGTFMVVLEANSPDRAATKGEEGWQVLMVVDGVAGGPWILIEKAQGGYRWGHLEELRGLHDSPECLPRLETLKEGAEIALKISSGERVPDEPKEFTEFTA